MSATLFEYNLAIMASLWVASEEICLSNDIDIFKGTLPKRDPSEVLLQFFVHGENESSRIMLVVSLTSVPSRRATDIRGTSVPYGAGVE